ncbi:hypothetical protein HXX76_005211 [Chlamydomonas incerta]|uniref:Methyltransferase n=1 Tax=Chlamydomonas incerta TaxID=51695 RepID=A0A835TE20_CHLIN|nr:hypothetical protein HXX76_005211 [Chlamydomonas incerta]|eukprot:KAG2438664.1 hypothetical protein HXX76_005211 [Chlamydomonas incerta]
MADGQAAAWQAGAAATATAEAAEGASSDLLQPHQQQPEPSPSQPQSQQQQQQPQQPDQPPAPAFTVDWITPHAHVWQQHIVPRLAGRPGVTALEIGCWEGRSALWLLAHVLTGPGSALVCVDPFELAHPPFARNRQVFEANLAASGERGRVRFLHMRSVAALPLLLMEALQPPQPPLPLPAPAADKPSAAPAAAAAPAAGAAAPAVKAAAAGSAPVAAPAPPPRAAAPAPMPSPHPPQPHSPRPQPAPQLPPPPPPHLQLVAVPRPGLDLVYIDGSHLRADVITDAVMAWPLLKVGGLLVFDDYAWPQYADNPVCHPRQAVDAFLQLFGHQLDVLSTGYQVMALRTAAT